LSYQHQSWFRCSSWQPLGALRKLDQKVKGQGYEKRKMHGCTLLVECAAFTVVGLHVDRTAESAILKLRPSNNHSAIRNSVKALGFRAKLEFSNSRKLPRVSWEWSRNPFTVELNRHRTLSARHATCVSRDATNVTSVCPSVTLVDCDHAVQQKWKSAHDRIGRCPATVCRS